MMRGSSTYTDRTRLTGSRSTRWPVSVSLSLAFALAACGTRSPAPPAAQSAADRVPAAWPYPLATDVVTADSAMVVTDAPLATRVGLDVLKGGGNAVDAAVATAFALAVVYPEAGNIGGGGFMVARMADGTIGTLDFREEAPGGATADMYVGADGKVTDASVIGHLASGVPGSVAGLFAAHERFGTKPWSELLEPAIRLAEDGFTVDADLAASVADAADRLRRFPAAAALFLPGGQPLAAGSTWKNPDLAAVLKRIAEQGPAGFYEGETADLIAAEMRRGGGLITTEDLKSYKAEWRDPVVFEYRGHQVISMPPPSSGGITLALIAGQLEGFAPESAPWHSPRQLHLLTEAMRRAFADRNTFLGDPDFVDIPRATLLSDAYIDRLRATIDTAHATPSDSIEPGLGEIPIAEPHAEHVPEPVHTTHFSIVDAQGNAVALTTTINELYGSAVAVAGAGFMLNDEMDDFTSKPGVPNMYGLVQGEANAIAPHKRMLSAMTPTIVVGEDGRPLLVTGARGGPRIITAAFQVMSNVLDYGMDIGAAVDAPRIHHQHLPDVLYYEADGLTQDEIEGLRARGHDVQERSGYIGSAPSILRRDGHWTAVPDPRQGGLAAGY